MNRESHITSVVLILVCAFSSWFGFICPSKYVNLSKNAYAFSIAYSFIGLFSLNIQYPISTLILNSRNRSWLILNSIITSLIGSSTFIFIFNEAGVLRSVGADLFVVVVPSIVLGLIASFTMLPLAFIWRLGKLKAVSKNSQS